MKYNIISLVLFLLIFTACRKNIKEPSPPEEVRAVLLSPLENEVFEQGDTIFLRADLSAQGWSMHAYEVYVYDSLNSYLAIAIHQHKELYKIDTFFVNSVASQTTPTVEFRLHLDHAGNRKDFRRTITLSP